ncbi:GNAT family N-acetyltransferase [Microbacterium protaetiae]|uniref:GNAT family N-acetyltransferase n=1 Tax=Microbacterium protaetiae TaxID=2509458 RepID=A0A4P6EK28_9MICO|nr:GNAT family N-acetyltransferase [Microbacterium protaetiae]QAY60487.1 GNAT family N-acetyltransferase [Microbacterium protaetiae]
MSVQVRRARPEEFEEIDRVIDDAYAHDYGPREHHDDMHRSAVRARDYDVLVAVDEHGAVVGSVTVRRRGGPVLHEDFGDDDADLRLLGVAPTARRQGVAAALMQQVIRDAAAAGYAHVTLKTGPDMHGAHRLYEALGFERAPEHDGLWIGGERVFDLLAYRYRLGATTPVPQPARSGVAE